MKGAKIVFSLLLPAVGAALFEDFGGSEEIFSYCRNVAFALQQLGIGEMVLAQLKAHAISSIRFNGFPDPVLCLSHVQVVDV